MSAAPSYTSIPLDDFETVFGSTSTEVSSVALGGKILDVSDDFFAPASDLLEVPAPPSLKGQFGPNGALFSGWESRRHNPEHDWVIIELGPPAAYIKGFDVDTTWFSGNEAPAASVEGIFSPTKAPSNDSPDWTPLLPVVPLGPSSRHLFSIPQTTAPFSHLRLRMYPDGGIARFRAYGLVAPTWAESQAWDKAEEGLVDLAHAFNGGRCVYTSDQHYSQGSNLVLPGRGVHMGDGWQTKRSRTKGHHDFAILKLGAPGTISAFNIDTLHFIGNYPAEVEIHAINSSEEIPSQDLESGAWTKILDRVKVGPHAEHPFGVTTEASEADNVFTHVRLMIYPDGGVKRLRIFGKRAQPATAAADAASSTKEATVGVSETDKGVDQPAKGGLSGKVSTLLSSLSSGRSSTTAATKTPSSVPPSSNLAPTSATDSASNPSAPALTIPVLPLHHSTFAPYGTVIQAYSSPSLAPPSMSIKQANAGSATKFHRLTVHESNYPEGSGEVTGISCFRTGPPEGWNGEKWEVRMFERHPYTKQSFIPMGKDDLRSGGEGMLVIVALNGPDDRPDPKTIKAFMASPAQGLTYNTGIWHHSVITLVPTDYACVETQISTSGDRSEDCEVLTTPEGVPGWATVVL